MRTVRRWADDFLEDYHSDFSTSDSLRVQEGWSRKEHRVCILEDHVPLESDSFAYRYLCFDADVILSGLMDRLPDCQNLPAIMVLTAILADRL